MEKIFQYLLGILILGVLVAYATSLVLSYLPFVMVVLAVLVPVYGYIRMQKQWNDRKFGLRIWLGKFGSLFKLKKSSWSFYLVLGIALGFIYEEVVWMMVHSLLVMAGGVVVMYFAWEGVRYGLQRTKNIQIPTFTQAFKSAW